MSSKTKIVVLHMKEIIYTVIFAALALLLILCVAIVSEWMKPSAETGEKQITVIVMDESGDTSKQVWEKTYQTDTENLTAFLKEKGHIFAKLST